MAVALTNLCGLACIFLLTVLVVLISGLVETDVDRIVLMLLHGMAWAMESVVLAGCLARGVFDWIPVRAGLRWAMVLTCHGILGLVALACLPTNGFVWELTVAIGVPFTIALYSLLLLNPAFRLRLPASAVRVPAILFGGVAAALATVSVPVTVETIRENWREAGIELRQKEALRQERVRVERMALQRLRLLGQDADLKDLFAFLSSESDLARGEVLERIAAVPRLTDRLAEILNRGEKPWAGIAAAYVADYYYGTSPETLCGPMSAHLSGLRAMLDSQLSLPWSQTRDYQRWALKAFAASRKLTRLGCSLDWEREQWLRRLESAQPGYLRDVLISAAGITTDQAPNLWITALTK